VAEFAVGLMLAAGKSIVKFDRVLRAGTSAHQRLDELGSQVTFFRGKTLGIVGMVDRQVDGEAGQAVRDEGDGFREASDQRSRG